MMTAIKSMYSTNPQTPAPLINIGMLCCVNIGKDWFRGVIKRVLSTGRLETLRMMIFLFYVMVYKVRKIRLRETFCLSHSLSLGFAASYSYLSCYN